MLPSFCLRLAWGLIAALILLPPSQVHPRFFRVQYLTALGLLAVAGFFVRDLAHLWFWLALAAGMLCAFAGSVIWHIDGNPGNRPVLVLSVPAMAPPCFSAAGYCRRFPRS